MDQRRSMYRGGWETNQRSAPPRDVGRPYSGYQNGNRGVTADLVGIATAVRAMPKVGANPDSHYRSNQSRPLPPRDDPFARRQDFPREEDPYARRNGDRHNADHGYKSYERPKPAREDPHARRQGDPRREDPYARSRSDPQGPKEDHYAKRNGQRNLADSPKDSTQWPATGGVISRAGYPSYRGGFTQPLQAHRGPYVHRQDARRSLVSGSSGSSYGSGSGHSDRSGHWVSKNKFRLIIGIIAGTVLLALTLGGVALWLFLKGGDTYPVAVEVKVTLPKETFDLQMGKADSKKFKDMKKKYCDAMDTVFGSTLLNCMVDQLSSGSVVVLSSLEFDWNDLTDLLKKTGKLLQPQNYYAYINNKIEKNEVEFLKDAVASTQVIPETVKYTLKLHLKGMNWTNDLKDPKSQTYKQTASDYCSGMKEAFSDTMSGCKVKGFTEGSVKVESELSFDTNKIKEKAKAGGGSLDLAYLGSVVQEQLKEAANKIDFFKTNELDTEKIEVKSETIQTPTSTTTTTTTTTTPASTTIIATEYDATTIGNQDSHSVSTASSKEATTTTSTTLSTTTSGDTATSKSTMMTATKNSMITESPTFSTANMTDSATKTSEQTSEPTSSTLESTNSASTDHTTSDTGEPTTTEQRTPEPTSSTLDSTNTTPSDDPTTTTAPPGTDTVYSTVTESGDNETINSTTTGATD